ncbi:MAG: Na(+)-translocating NADH-quinone reductase subunit A, partial [Gammaproteobacteria bacterium]|nr:Na(+)-translocating NADH-quinone reductase subunit A [Gammaproteobacteria bacterium]
EPEPVISAGAEVSRVAFLGADFLTLRQLPRVLVNEGEQVRLGQALIQSKQYPAVVGTAPGCGVVERIIRGKRRSLKAIIIRLESDAEQTFTCFDPDTLDSLSVEQIKTQLLAAGLWLALRTRPYSLTPSPDSEPAALFINAADTQPLAPPPEKIISAAAADFLHGVQVVSRLCQGTTFLCVGGETVIPQGCEQYARLVQFSGPHPAGLVGTHIHYLYPVDEHRMAWTIHYQDVIAIGRLFTSGRLSTGRIISLGGPLLRKPRLIRTRIGAALNELLANELLEEGENARILSGSVLAGREALDWANYLGWFHYQVTAIRENPKRELLGWLAPGGDKFSALRVFLSHLRSRRTRYAMDGNYHGSARAMMPIGVYEKVMPLDLLITPLLRALLVEDIESAIELGCLELDEEDLALCSFVCPGKHDFGPVLRAVLDKIRQELQP